MKKLIKNVTCLSAGIITSLSLLFASKIQLEQIKCNDACFSAQKITQTDKGSADTSAYISYSDKYEGKIHEFTLEDTDIDVDKPSQPDDGDKPENNDDRQLPPDDIPEDEPVAEPEESKSINANKKSQEIIGVIAITATLGIAGLLLVGFFKRKQKK